MQLEIVTYLIDLAAIVPLSFGFYKINKIHKSYYWLLLYLILDFISQLTFPLFSNNWIRTFFELIFDYTSILCLLFLLYKWGFIKNNKIEKKLWILLFMLIGILDLFFQKNTEMRPPWMFIIGSCIWMVLALKYISNINSRSSPTNSNKSIFLIILPLVSLMIYYTVLQILMANLLNEKTESCFRNLYKFIVILRIVIFTCFSIAFLWAPNKEIYLETSEELDNAPIAS
jgi:hypothetical protein